MEIENKTKIYSKEKILLNISIFFLVISLILLGFLTNRMVIVLGFGIGLLAMIIKNMNLLYSVLMILYLFHSTYFTLELRFEWTSLYYIMAILIIVCTVTIKMIGTKFLNLFKDQYLYLMAIILSWGILSALFSTQVVQSVKNILSIFLVFIIFYIIPTYFYSNLEKGNHLKYILYPTSAVMTIISLVNLLYFLNFVDIKKYFTFWTVNSSIYRNSNSFGLNIMVILMIMNIFISSDKKTNKILSKNRLLKIYFLFSYPILLINIIISGSRASLLGWVIAFVPLIFKKRIEALITGIVAGVILFNSESNLLLFKKIDKGTMSGRDAIWSYTFNEVIAKYPILGVGSGGSQDYIGIFGGLSVHNSYLNVIMSLGFVGFMFWMFILFLVLYKSYKLNESRYIFIFTILGFMVFSFFETTLFGGMGLRMSIFWSIVMLLEYQINTSYCDTDKLNQDCF